MFLIVLKNTKTNGAFSVINENNEKVLLFFEEYDDAERYKMMLEDQESLPELEIAEYDETMLIKTANTLGYNYSVITPYDLVVPPNTFETL